ncbi:MAG: DUF4831 family protein [Bacteroidales bacterium]|nr:DUF4831 family protein [Candidatus Colicola faecequi]
MKHIASVALFAALILGFSAAPAHAQVGPSEAAIVYYMPHTDIVVDLEYDEVTLKQGPFYQYSERYLATKNIVMEDGVRYVLKSVTLRTRTTADKERAYSFVPAAGKKVVLNQKGLLCGIGIDEPQAEKPAKESAKKPAAKIIENEFAGLLEEQILASSVSKMAEGTAKQIYHIREARLNWLCGEVENMPADGKSLEMILAQLDRQEKQLTSLFLGKETHKTLHKRVVLEAKDYNDEVVVRFSEISGPVEADDLSGEPIYLTATCSRQQYEGDKKSATASQLYYNLPGTIDCTLSDGEKTIQEKTIQVGQFGISVALPAQTAKSAKKICLDPNTGALISVE